ncbi:MAG TPA: hypothetical protein VN697_05005 [Tepidiformaceae bacterium]|nr:hypothetical protein [Tepidiformaceae bacterium]
MPPLLGQYGDREAAAGGSRLLRGDDATPAGQIPGWRSFQSSKRSDVDTVHTHA